MDDEHGLVIEPNKYELDLSTLDIEPDTGPALWLAMSISIPNHRTMKPGSVCARDLVIIQPMRQRMAVHDNPHT